MKKLVGFGDSFITKNTDSWLEKTGMMLDLPVINYGVRGSSMGYSLLKFLEYAKSDKYDLSDIIVWVTSSDDRIYVKGMKPYLTNVHHRTLTTEHKKEDKEWLNKNLEHLLWMAENYFHPSINLETIKTLCLLQSWIRAHPSNLMVVKTGFDISKIRSGELKHIIKQSDNFLPIIDFPLDITQSQEFVNKESGYATMIKRDPRVNHLSKPNREILSKMIYDVIVNRSIDFYDGSKFLSKFVGDIGHPEAWI